MMAASKCTGSQATQPKAAVRWSVGFATIDTGHGARGLAGACGLAVTVTLFEKLRAPACRHDLIKPVFTAVFHLKWHGVANATFGRACMSLA